MLERYKRELNYFQEQLNPDVVGIFWFVEQELKNHPPYFKIFDYFLDGALSQFIAAQPQQALEFKKNLFFTQHFSNPFFIAYLNKDLEKLNLILEELVEIALNLPQKDKKILVLDATFSNFRKDLTNRKDLKFIKCDLSQTKAQI